MKKNIIIVGAGGFGREVYQWSIDAFDDNLYNIKGFLSKNKNDLDSSNISLPILGCEDTYEIEENDVFIIAIGNVDIKKNVVAKLKKLNASFLNLIHPTAIISENSTIGEGVVICPYCVVTDEAEIGNFTMLNIYVYFAHHSKSGEYCILSPYATLNGYARIGNEVFMATRATVTNGKIVGDNSVIGAHSLVLHDIPENSKVLGVSKA